jgi:hypothetical protein
MEPGASSSVITMAVLVSSCSTSATMRIFFSRSLTNGCVVRWGGGGGGERGVRAGLLLGAGRISGGGAPATRTFKMDHPAPTSSVTTAMRPPFTKEKM